MHIIVRGLATGPVSCRGTRGMIRRTLKVACVGNWRADYLRRGLIVRVGSAGHPEPHRFLGRRVAYIIVMSLL